MRKGQHKMNLTDSEYTNMVQHLLTKYVRLHPNDCPTGLEACFCRLVGQKDDLHSVGQRKKVKSRRKQLYTDLPQRIQTIPQS
ncbi:hypothetical protein H257_06596 [Aphanomyces astaci]|uniref:Uncharacterized protein n=1 Tax=Aphanomyces astaci TaxID=112090 RepID=W4GKN4_APHAT|nr:hypothetical protein H257_06596 [Aphanomyces astaci]ETV80255.1 hypothetical protein H257_06596 [Aphanomyces astaci]|eukprot:XP_009830179.1 hypothetical protein H257_06596 [Aphanomyces astaci]